VKKFSSVCAAALLGWAAQAQAQWVDPSLDWRTLDTAHFSLHFAAPYRAQAQAAAEVAESVYPRVTGWLHWKPESRTHVLLLDSADFSNGYATPLPFNTFAIFLSPPDSGELLQNRAWLDLVITHEFTHVVHLDKARGAPLVMRRIFGRWLFIFPVALPSAFPNLLEPDWLIEGLAVYSESDWNKGWGRLGQSQFEGEMRAETARGLRSVYEVNAEGRGFPLNRDYLYGGYFFAFLAERYGPDAVARYVENYSDDWVPFRVHSNPRAITGKPMDALWIEYHDWLRARFAKPAAAPGTAAMNVPDASGDVLERAWSITSPALGPNGDRWYVRADGYTLPKLVRAERGREAEPVRSVESGTRAVPSPGGGVLLSQYEICGNYNYYYDLYRVSADGDRERVTRCGRYRFAAPLDDGRIAAVRVAGGEAEVVLLNGEGAAGRPLYRAAPGEAITGLAAKGEALAVTSLRDGVFSLIGIDGGGAKVLLADSAIKHSPRFGESADEIYFVANYGNVYDVWSFRRGEKSLSRWTRSATGVAEISAPEHGEMLLTTIEADGGALRLLQLPQAPLERRDAAVAANAPAPAPEPRRAPPDRPYTPWSSLMPRAWLPAAQIADGAVAFGAATYGQDALGLHQYSLAPMFEFSQHEWLGSASYLYNDRHQLLLDRTLLVRSSADKSGGSNGLTDKDITAYTTTDRAQWVSTAQTLSLATRAYVGLGGALDRERFHEVGDGTTADRDERVLGLVAGVDTRREQWLSEGPSEGQQLRLFAETSNGLRGAYSGNVYRGDWRGHLALGTTVLSARWNEVYAQPDAEPIRLGGSFSEETFALPVLNQRDFPLRGYLSGEPALTGHRARLGTLEWRVPLADVDRHIMVPPGGLDRVSMSVFGDVGSAWDDSAQHRYLKSAGVEFLSEVRLGYQFGAQLRAGVAKGLETPGRTTWYLHVGRSF
jgi:hypothetical protein